MCQTGRGEDGVYRGRGGEDTLLLVGDLGGDWLYRGRRGGMSGFWYYEKDGRELRLRLKVSGMDSQTARKKGRRSAPPKRENFRPECARGLLCYNGDYLTATTS